MAAGWDTSSYAKSSGEAGEPRAPGTGLAVELTGGSLQPSGLNRGRLSLDRLSIGKAVLNSQGVTRSWRVLISFWYGAGSEFYPDLQNWTLTLGFDSKTSSPDSEKSQTSASWTSMFAR